jgi:hypothetical protein
MSTLVGESGMGRSEVSLDPTVGTPPTGSDSSADPTHHLPPEVLAGLGAILPLPDRRA